MGKIITIERFILDNQQTTPVANLQIYFMTLRLPQR